MATVPKESETVPLASKLIDISARQDVDVDQRWEEVAKTAESLANRLRTREGEVDEHSALGRTPLPRTLTALINEALAAHSAPSVAALSAVFELLRTSANFCMDHDDNRQLLLAANFPQSVVALLQRYSPTRKDASQPLSLSLMELKILKTSAGVLLNASLQFDPIRDYLIVANVPETLLRLQTRIYPPCSWSTLNNETRTVVSDVKEEWIWRSGFSDWASLALSELFRDNETSRLLTVRVLDSLIGVLKRFTPPWPAPSGPLIEDPTTRHTLITADVDLLNDASCFLESLALDSEDVQEFLARTGAVDNLDHGDTPLLQCILDFVESGDYPPYWSKDPIPEQAKRHKTFDMCKAAIIKAVVEVTGASSCPDILWDLHRSNGWFVLRMIDWIRSNLHGGRDDLVICATLCLGNLARRPSHCIALVHSPFSLVTELGLLLGAEVDIKLKHGALGLLKHLSQSPSNRRLLGEARILEKLTKSEIWSDRSDMAETVQLSAIGTAKHLCNENFGNAMQLAESRATASVTSLTGIDQILALVKRSDTIAVKSEGTRVVVNVIKSICSSKQVDMLNEQQRKALELVTTSSATTALAELIGRSAKYPALINEGLSALTLLCSVPSGSPLVAQALLSPLPMDPISVPSRSTSQSSQTSPISSPATCLTMLHNILTVDLDSALHDDLRAAACSLLAAVGRKDIDGSDVSFLRDHSRNTLASLVNTSSTEGNDKIRIAAQNTLAAWGQTDVGTL
ncbi:hypothetical protein K439DRAFT_1403733 [Ramaria rubella]|nr:hypothetical protein K439DRAFT_1403733 [Ramaria rubella]